MAQREIVEIIYGKHAKYEIVKYTTITGSEYFIYKNGNYHRGSFPSLRAAVEAAKAEG